VDVPAVVRGGAGSLNLPELRTADGLAMVLAFFSSEAAPHPEGSLDPARDLELLETELLLADLAVTESRLERLGRELGKRRTAELEAEKAALERCRAALAEGVPLRAIDLDADERLRLKGFGFLTAKPLLVVINAGEEAVRRPDEAIAAAGLASLAERAGVTTVVVSASLEEEIARLEPEDQAAFLADLGLAESALDRLLRAAYAALGLISFLTVGEDECRAWTITAGTPAVRAAGAIHSDFERGFIRAEVGPWDELLEAGSIAACRQRDTLRLEGRDYRVADGDVINFRVGV